MQFIFGSDHTNGYGFLFAEDLADAERVFSQITLPTKTDIDFCGFLSFGPNGNRPLIFRSHRDTGYSREAYYLHGICREARDGYYSDGSFFRDLFTRFASQEWVNARRAGTVTELPQELDTALWEQTGADPGITEEAQTEILARVLAGEDFVITVEDEGFSNDYARLLMHRLYSCLPPAAIKACSFLTAVPDARGVRIKILSRRDAAGCTEEKVDTKSLQQREIPLFSEMARSILEYRRRDPEGLCRLYEEYHFLCNGFGSNYKPKQFAEFFKAFGGQDALTAKKLLDDYLSVTQNPDFERIPSFVKQALGEELKLFEKEFTLPEGKLSLPDPAEVLKRNHLWIKELYCVDPVLLQEKLARLYGDFAQLRLKEEGELSVDCLRERLESGLRSRGENLPRYQQLFFAVADGALAALSARVEACLPLREAVQRRAEVFLDNCPTEHVPQEQYYRFGQIFASALTDRIQEAESLDYDIRSLINRSFYETMAEHERRYPYDPDPEGTALIRRLQEELESPFPRRNELYTRFGDVFSHEAGSSGFGGETALCLKQFVLGQIGLSEGPVNPRAAACFEEKGGERLLRSLAQLAKENLPAVLAFAAANLSFSGAFCLSVEAVMQNGEAWEALDKHELKELLSFLEKALREKNDGEDSLSRPRCISRCEVAAEELKENPVFAKGSGKALRKTLLPLWKKEAKQALS